ncbi:hypothetical protein BCR32DRAFT_309344 [Anaeromyces robustus]|uniref:Uncharacterized protein n=1 Tax=Anaeromyces robustus TaxID=1754192 RepID=A0A1Y1X9A8_9FUNG|nr:hypothetical protein BCR32DRAFT_309344 [Anaeromyces robustus]|eukprot:ORX82340.1 hypothetical protein BCR32DRAFT_309344 [Anaeromyces robustus]
MDLNNTSKKYEDNTKLFFEELNKKKCNINKLKSLSKDGIYLSEPLFYYDNIKYDESVIDISFENRQLMRIYNEKQFFRLKDLVTNANNIPNHYRYYATFVIPDEYFIKLLISNLDCKYWECFEYSGFFGECFNTNVLLYYFYKWNYTSAYVVTLFNNEGKLSVDEIIIILFTNFFYLHENNNFMNIEKYISRDILINSIIENFGKDKRVLEFIVNTFTEKVECYNYFRIPLYYPFSVIKYFSEKIFKPNYLIYGFVVDREYDKDVKIKSNIIFSDKLLSDPYFSNIVWKYENFLNKYNEALSFSHFYTIFNIDNFSKNYTDIYQNCNLYFLWYDNKDLFNSKINNDFCKLERFSGPKFFYEINEDYGTKYYNIIYKKTIKYINTYLKEDNISKILNNPNNIFKLCPKIYSVKLYNLIIKIFVICILLEQKEPLIVILTLIYIMIMDDNFNMDTSINQNYIVIYFDDKEYGVRNDNEDFNKFILNDAFYDALQYIYGSNLKTHRIWKHILWIDSS